MKKTFWIPAAIRNHGRDSFDGVQVSIRDDGRIVLTDGQPPEDGDYFMTLDSGEEKNVRVINGQWFEVRSHTPGRAARDRY